MADFPTLKSGAVAQYPSDRTRSQTTAIYEFVDGSEQRFATSRGALRRWLIRLDLLEEAELARLEEFFVEQGGPAGSFSFVDPWDDVEHLDCSFEADELDLTFAGFGGGRMSLAVRENR